MKRFYGPVVRCATGLALLCLVGCGEDPKPSPQPAVDRASPQSYMNDKPFMEKLKAQKQSRQVILQMHMEARRAYEAALKADPQGAKSETQRLKAKAEELEREYRRLRQETMKTVRDRLTPEKKGK